MLRDDYEEKKEIGWNLISKQKDHLTGERTIMRKWDERRHWREDSNDWCEDSNDDDEKMRWKEDLTVTWKEKTAERKLSLKKTSRSCVSCIFLLVEEYFNEEEEDKIFCYSFPFSMKLFHKFLSNDIRRGLIMQKCHLVL